MSQDRFIRWGPTPEWGPPTRERLMQVARDFLGASWFVVARGQRFYCTGSARTTQPLASEHVPGVEGRPTPAQSEEWRGDHFRYRGFEVYLGDLTGQDPDNPTSVITRLADRYTSALADEYARIVAGWWGGSVEWGDGTVTRPPEAQDAAAGDGGRGEE